MPFTAWKHAERNRHREKSSYYDFMMFGDSSTVHTQPPVAVKIRVSKVVADHDDLLTH